MKKNLNPYVTEIMTYDKTDCAAIKECAEKLVETGKAIFDSLPIPARYMTPDLFRELFGIRLSESMTGKLENVLGISTFAGENKNCETMAADPTKVCSHCYAMAYSSFKPIVRETYTRNGRVLKNAIIPVEYWPVMIGYPIARIESFGDVASTIQCINYINFTRANAHITFTFFTKAPGFWNMAIKQAGKPENMVSVVSNPFLNGSEFSINFSWADYIFTVYDMEYAAENNIEINCGGKRCITCQRCFTHNNTGSVIRVNELLKEDTTHINKIVRNYEKLVSEISSFTADLNAAENDKDKNRISKKIENRKAKLAAIIPDYYRFKALLVA